MHEWPDNAALVARGEVGDPRAALASADLVVHETIRHARLAGAPIEPRGVLAYRDAESGLLVVSSSTQNPYRVREVVASVLGLAAEEVRVRVPDVGGGFGPKGGVYPEEILVATAAVRLGRPVKWVETRREDLLATGQDREQVHDVAIGFRRDGTIVGIEGTFLADVGAYPPQGDGLTLNTVNHLPGPYRVPAYRNAGTSIVTTKAPNAAYRAAGRPEAALVMERLVDIGARRLGLDPAEVRRRNLIRPDEMPYRPGLTYKDGVPIAYDPGDFPAAFEHALAMLDYDGWRSRQKTQALGARRVGIGLACYAQGTGLGPFEGATVRVDPSGKVYVFIGVTAQGQGHGTTLAQIAAAELGAPLEDVQIVTGDTTLFPFGMGTGGSRVTANAGPAVARTAREVRQRAGRVAAELLECAPDDVRVENGRVHVAGLPDRFVTLGRVAQARGEVQGDARGRRAGPERVHVLLSGHGHLGVRHAGRRRRGGRRDARRAPAEVRGRARSRTRHQPDDRRGPAPGRRRPGHRRRADGSGRLRRRRPAPDRKLHGLRDPARRGPAGARGRARSSTARRSTSSASRASARAAASRAPPPSPTRSRTPSPTSVWRFARPPSRPRACSRSSRRPAAGAELHLASGSGRSWNLTTLGRFSLPPSLWNTVRVE